MLTWDLWFYYLTIFLLLEIFNPLFNWSGVIYLLKEKPNSRSFEVPTQELLDKIFNFIFRCLEFWLLGIINCCCWERQNSTVNCDCECETVEWKIYSCKRPFCVKTEEWQYSSMHAHGWLEVRRRTRPRGRGELREFLDVIYMVSVLTQVLSLLMYN